MSKEIIDLPWPMCAVCKKTVQQIICFENLMTDTTVYLARCHGQEEKVELSRYMMIGTKSIEAGVAFADKLPELDHLNKSSGGKGV